MHTVQITWAKICSLVCVGSFIKQNLDHPMGCCGMQLGREVNEVRICQNCSIAQNVCSQPLHSTTGHLPPLLWQGTLR